MNLGFRPHFCFGDMVTFDFAGGRLSESHFVALADMREFKAFSFD